jgi:hypothetical protein
MRWGSEEAEVGEGSPAIRVRGWGVPGEGIFCAQIRAACTDLRGPAENPDLLVCWRLPGVFEGADASFP